MQKRTFIILTIFTIVITGIFSFYQVKPRKITNEQLQSVQFQNTMNILHTITQVTHPSGSAANYKVRDYLVKEIEALGLKAEVIPFEVSLAERIMNIEDKMRNNAEYQSYMMKFMKAKGYDNPRDFVRGKFGNVKTDTVTLYNILVKLDAPQSDDAIMLVSHYDSVATGPGAGDDGIAAASMLNYLQQAVAGKTARNDIYFLFTDGEEQGLLGAYEHVENSDEKTKENIKSVFNFEARGNQGGLFMFESSKDNYDLVNHLNKAVPQPIAFSLATAIYDNMPNDTDFSVFKRAKYEGLNFAMVEGFENYHASTDTVENLDKNTAYQYMQTVSGIGEYFGKLDFSVFKSKQKGVFFPFLGLGTIILPEMVGYVLGCLPLLLALLLFYKNKSRKHDGAALAGMCLRIIIGLAICELTRRVLPASYIVSIPLSLFFLVDLIKEYEREKIFCGPIIFLFAVFTLIVLNLPLMYMIQIALHTWYITMACIALPLMLIAIYFRKVLKLYKRNELAKNLA